MSFSLGGFIFLMLRKLTRLRCMALIWPKIPGTGGGSRQWLPPEWTKSNNLNPNGVLPYWSFFQCVLYAHAEPYMTGDYDHTRALRPLGIAHVSTHFPIGRAAQRSELIWVCESGDYLGVFSGTGRRADIEGDLVSGLTMAAVGTGVRWGGNDRRGQGTGV